MPPKKSFQRTKPKKKPCVLKKGDLISQSSNASFSKNIETLQRELGETMEQQAATGEILRVIASSPSDLQPVLDAIAASAARVCSAEDATIRLVEGNVLRMEAHHGTIERGEVERPISRHSVTGRAVTDCRLIHIEDLLSGAHDEFPESVVTARRTGVRTVLALPLLREGVPIGVIFIRRTEVLPFSEKQIDLLKTFADQAVIAIENVRLFQELQARTRKLARSVEELKALGEVGQAVSSTLDIEKVLETIVARAVQLSGTDCGVIHEYDERRQEFHLRASHGMEQEIVEALRATPIRWDEGATGRAVATRAPVQIANMIDQREPSTRVRPMLTRLGYRSLLSVPLFREQQIMGGLTVWRRQSASFDPEVVNLLQTFATQSALAIQNARLFREIENKSRQLEAANRHKSEFLANVSHELRTPLNAIIGFSEVLGEEMFGELNEKQSEYIDDIVSSGRHLLSLINDILDLSKIEAGRMELELRKFDLPTAVENALILMRERATRHGIRLQRTVDERLGEFVGDERKLKQVLLNLLSNAVKFTPEGGQIRVEAQLDDGLVKISVSDTGVGIASEDHALIFEEFRQVGWNYERRGEGTGLGLSLTRKFVEMHGGQIWVESAPGQGSTFTFTLPTSVSGEG
jgi:signal transduction histidine kinase/putative methionine-R-sulfoxide reductase with GAF domain